MGSKKKNPFIVDVSYFLLFMISSAHAALADLKKASARMIIDDFCYRRSTREDRLFCALVFQPNNLQARTTSIKDNLGLLRVALQFSLGNAMETYKDFLNKETDIAAVLQQCLAAYSDYIKELKIILGDLEDDPPVVNYDSRMAGLALSRCHNSLSASNKIIDDDSILGRDEVAQQYSKLILEISKIV